MLNSNVSVHLMGFKRSHSFHFPNFYLYDFNRFKPSINEGHSSVMFSYCHRRKHVVVLQVSDDTCNERRQKADKRLTRGHWSGSGAD